MLWVEFIIYAIYFQHVQELTQYLYLRLFSNVKVWSVNHASYFEHLRFMNSVDIWGYAIVTYLQRPFSILSQFFSIFSACKFYKLGLYVITYFSHGKCFILEFLVLAFLKCSSLTNICLFEQFFLICKWYKWVFKLYMSGL